MATTESTWTFERISDLDRDVLLDLWRTLPADGFTPVADPATGRTRHEVFGLHGPTGPWVGVDDPSAEAR
jgi:hypothetical protein